MIWPLLPASTTNTWSPTAKGQGNCGNLHEHLIRRLRYHCNVRTSSDAHSPLRRLSLRYNSHNAPRLPNAVGIDPEFVYEKRNKGRWMSETVLNIKHTFTYFHESTYERMQEWDCRLRRRRQRNFLQLQCVVRRNRFDETGHALNEAMYGFDEVLFILMR